MAHPHQNIFDLFESVCQEDPFREAILFREKEFLEFRSLSYKDVYYKSLFFAYLLKEKGIGRGDVVGLLLENGPLWPLAALGVFAVGAVLVPLYPLAEQEEIRAILAQSNAKILLTSPGLASSLRVAMEGIPMQELTLEEITDEAVVGEEFTAEHLALLVFTSGTTGAAKGVMLTHANLMANIASLQKLNLLNRNDNILCLLPLYHTYPLMVSCLLPLVLGARITFPANLDIEEISRSCRATGVTIIPGVPRFFALLRERIKKNIAQLPLWQRGLLGVLLQMCACLEALCRLPLNRIVLAQVHEKFGGKLRFMISGGARLEPEVATDLRRWGFRIYEGYGLTETSPVVSYNLFSSHRPGSVGRPIPGVEVRIEAPDRKGIGEVLIRGSNVTPGYFNDQALTRERIQEGWFRTRDLGCIDKDGFLFISGRKDEVIVLASGKKLAPDEIERQYLRSPFIDEVCVFPSAGGDTLSAAIVPNRVALEAAGVSQVKDRIRLEVGVISQRLAPHQRIAKCVIVNERLPRTVMGKLKRFEVAQRYGTTLPREDKPSASKELTSDDLALLDNPACRRVLEYLSEKLKRQVVPADHLELDLGLDSLERITLFFEFQKAASVEVDEKLFFNVSTVRDVLSVVAKVGAAPAEHARTLDWGALLNKEAEVSLRRAVTLTPGVLRTVMNFLFLAWWRTIACSVFRLSVRGREHLPRRGPFFICPTHTSYLDPLIVAASLPFPIFMQTYFMGFRVILESICLRWAKKLFRLIPIDAAGEVVETFRICSFVLKNGKALCMFPEGGRSPNGAIQEFKRGAAILIKELDVPIVPVYLKGVLECWPAGKRLPKPGRALVVFGKPVTVAQLLSKSDTELDIYQNIAHTLRRRLLELQTSVEEGFMGVKVQELKVLLSSDERRTDRLQLPVKVSYRLINDDEWSQPVNVIDISGGGCKFNCRRKFEPYTIIQVKLLFPEKHHQPITAQAVVTWSRFSGVAIRQVGVRYVKMEQEERKRYVEYISDKLLLACLDARK